MKLNDYKRNQPVFATATFVQNVVFLLELTNITGTWKTANNLANTFMSLLPSPLATA